MIKKNLLFILLFILLLCFIVPIPGTAGETSFKLAFLSIENLNKDPQYDYLTGIIQSVLLKDLSEADRINLVNRKEIKNILQEQRFRLSGVSNDNNKAVIVGNILGADYLVKGGYVFLGEDVLVTITLVDVVTAQTTVFSERGTTENTIHLISEQIIYKLTGNTLKLTDKQNLSIISVNEKIPGSIEIYSRIIDAEIFIDDSFSGYTKGDVTVPIILKDIEPGIHTVRIHLDRSFGVIHLPEITFHDWEETINIEPGKNFVLRDKTAHFNGILYKLQNLLRNDFTIDPDTSEKARYNHSLTFIDREGEEVKITIAILTEPLNNNLKVTANLTYNGLPYSVTLLSEQGREKELNKEIGKVEFSLSIDNRYGKKYDIDYSLQRIDIRQNMF